MSKTNFYSKFQCPKFFPRFMIMSKCATEGQKTNFLIYGCQILPYMKMFYVFKTFVNKPYRHVHKPWKEFGTLELGLKVSF